MPHSLMTVVGSIIEYHVEVDSDWSMSENQPYTCFEDCPFRKKLEEQKRTNQQQTMRLSETSNLRMSLTKVRNENAMLHNQLEEEKYQNEYMFKICDAMRAEACDSKRLDLIGQSSVSHEVVMRHVEDCAKYWKSKLTRVYTSSNFKILDSTDAMRRNAEIDSFLRGKLNRIVDGKGYRQANISLTRRT